MWLALDYLPLSFELKNQPVLLVGAGKVALRKARILLKAHAHIVIVAPNIEPAFYQEFKHAFETAQMVYREASYQSTDLENVTLVIAATNQPLVNKQVSDDARARFLPVNVVDQPELSSVIFPSIIERAPVTVAISTAGRAPVLARLLRAKIETLIPAYYGELATLVEQYRGRVKQLLPDTDQRKAFWEKVLSGTVAEHLLIGRTEQASLRLEKFLGELEHNNSAALYEGEVYLVGAGPGDPDLLSFKALRLLQQADVVLYDRLVSQEIIELARRDAERIYVGKKQAEHSMPQESINELLVRLAKEGKRVCRLKGGDPFIFGRGGEELETLAAAGVSFQVVPGVTAASGCAAYAGIPLTHRDYSQSVMFVTGHRRVDARHALKWKAMAEGDQTLVFYMGLHEIETISRELVHAGMRADMPAAVIQQGTTRNQKVVVGALGELPQLVRDEQIKAPTLIIVGEVVQLREKLNWFDEEK